MPWATPDQARAWGRAYHARTKDRRQGELFVNKLKTLYGLSILQYLAMQQHQDYRCAVCRETCKTGQRLSIDHDHETGRVRGLLCRRCNTLVGPDRAHADRMKRALAYVDSHDVPTLRRPVPPPCGSMAAPVGAIRQDAALALAGGRYRED